MTYHRTIYTFAVLSEGLIDPEMDLQTVLAETQEGPLLEDWAYDSTPVVVELTAEEMAAAAIEAGSDPGFFGLTADGDPESEN